MFEYYTEEGWKHLNLKRLDLKVNIFETFQGTYDFRYPREVENKNENMKMLKLAWVKRVQVGCKY